MYHRLKCPTCGEDIYSNLRVHHVMQVCRGIPNSELVDIETMDICTASEIAHAIMQDIRGHVKDGISIMDLCRIIMQAHGIPGKYCCDLIQQIKVELDMYSPDREHLYFVE